MSPTNMHTHTSILPGSTDMYMCINSHGGMCMRVSHTHVRIYTSIFPGSTDMYMCINSHGSMCIRVSHKQVYKHIHIPREYGYVYVYKLTWEYLYIRLPKNMCPTNMYTCTSISPGSTDVYMCINSHGSMCIHVSHKHAYTSSHKHVSHKDVSHKHGSADMYMCVNKHGSMCIHVSHEQVSHKHAHTFSHKHGSIHVYTCMCLCLCVCLFIHIYTLILPGLYGCVCLP